MRILPQVFPGGLIHGARVAGALQSQNAEVRGVLGVGVGWAVREKGAEERRGPVVVAAIEGGHGVAKVGGGVGRGRERREADAMSACADAVECADADAVERAGASGMESADLRFEQSA